MTRAPKQPRAYAIRVLQPPRTYTTPGRPQCDAQVKVVNAAWRLRQGDTGRCAMLAAYEIDGKNLCHRHAGEAAIRKLMGESS